MGIKSTDSTGLFAGACSSFATDTLVRGAGLVGCVRALTAAKTALGHELGSQKNRRLSEVWERLERLEEALRQAPGQMVEHLRQRTAEFASTHSLDVMEIHRGVLGQAVRPRQDHF